MMMEKPINRMELSGPNRKTIQKILNNDRKIVAQLITASAINVLEKKYGWDESQVKEFHCHLQSEINKL
ncbi:hypothetical protein ACSU64_27630 [Bacillaceae bacterium C204]|uniref:hypothetical protein n=1 Tax=Neobacillus sp. 204 TaxID=3383351 RepID=UPI00397B3E5F